MCLLGCGVSTGWGAVWNTCEVENGASVAVFGCGAVGLSVIQAAKLSGARRIIAIDINPSKFGRARLAPRTVSMSTIEEPIQQHLVKMTQWGWGALRLHRNTEVTRHARCRPPRLRELRHRRGRIGKRYQYAPFQLVTGRKWVGTAFGGWKSRSDVPKLVDRYLEGELEIDAYITHTFDGVDKTNDAFDALHGGDCLRAVVRYGD